MTIGSLMLDAARLSVTFRRARVAPLCVKVKVGCAAVESSCSTIPIWVPGIGDRVAGVGVEGGAAFEVTVSGVGTAVGFALATGTGAWFEATNRIRRIVPPSKST